MIFAVTNNPTLLRSAFLRCLTHHTLALYSHLQPTPLFTGDKSEPIVQTGLALHKNMNWLMFRRAANGALEFHDPRFERPLKDQIRGEFKFVSLGQIAGDFSGGDQVSFWLFCALVVTDHRTMPTMPDAWMELIRSLRMFSKRQFEQEMPPLDWQKVFRDCLVPEPSNNTTDPTQDTIIAATELLTTISEGSVMWWQANHLLETLPRIVTATDAIQAWGDDKGATYVAYIAEQIFAAATSALAQPDAAFASWAKCERNLVIGNPTGIFTHLIHFLARDGWEVFDKVATQMWKCLTDNYQSVRSRAYLDAVVVKEHPFFMMLYSVWVCSSCKLRHSTTRLHGTGNTLKIQKASCKCGAGSNPNRSLQIQLDKSAFARDDSGEAQRKRHDVAVKTAASDTRMAKKLAESVHGFPNFSDFKCSVTALLAWLYKSPVRAFFVASEKSDSLAKALACWQDSDCASGAKCAFVLHSMVHNTWECLKLSDEQQELHEVFQALLAEAPYLASAFSYTVIETIEPGGCSCSDLVKKKHCSIPHEGSTVHIHASSFTQESVSTSDLLFGIKIERELRCESCQEHYAVFGEQSVDLTTCKELFAVELRRDRWIKSRAGAGVTRKKLQFRPCLELSDNNGRVFKLQAAFVYIGSGATGHYQVYIMHPEERFYGNGVQLFSDADCEKVAWPPTDAKVFKNMVMAIYSTAAVTGQHGSSHRAARQQPPGGQQPPGSTAAGIGQHGSRQSLNLMDISRQ